MNTDSLYLALAGKEMYDCIRGEKSQEWELFCSKDCNNSITADACRIFSPDVLC